MQYQRLLTLSEIQQATLADPTLQQFTKMVCTVNWDDQTNSEADKAELQLFSKINGDLTVNSDKTVILSEN